MKILSFQDFLNESLQIPILKDPEKFLTGILHSASKQKLVKKICAARESKHQKLYTPNEGTPVAYLSRDVNGRRIFYKSFYFFIIQSKLVGVCLESGGVVDAPSLRKTLSDPSLEDMNVLVYSETPLDTDALDQVFQETIEASIGNRNFSYNRSILEEGKMKLNVHNRSTWSGFYDNSEIEVVLKTVERHCVVYNYKAEVVETDITLEEIKNTDEYKSLLKDFPVDLISTSRQLKNKTLQFGLRSSHVLLFKHSDKKELLIPEHEYLYETYAIFERGYIREVPFYSVSKFSQPMSKNKDSFTATSLEGWKKGLVKVKELFIKLISDLEKEKTFFFYISNPQSLLAPEEIQDRLVELAKERKADWQFIKPYISRERWEDNETEATLSSF